MSDSDEESKKYSVREMSKSGVTALNGVLHYNRKLLQKSVCLNVGTVELISSVISIFGKDMPEVFFYGTNTLVYQVRLAMKSKSNADESPQRGDMAVLGSEAMISKCLLTCVNAINFFKSKDSDDSSLIGSSFELLSGVLMLSAQSVRIKRPAQEQLADLITSDFLAKLTAEACSSAMNAVCLLLANASQTDPDEDNLFLKKELVVFSSDFITNISEQDEDSGSETMSGSRGLVLFAGMYLSLALPSRQNEDCRSILVTKLFRSVKVVSMSVSMLLTNLNSRLFLFVLIRLVSQILSSALVLRDEVPAGEDSGFFQSSELPISSKVPALFEAVELEVLDDVFAAYTEEDESGVVFSESDSQVILALFALAQSLVRHYSSSNSTRGSLVLATVRKWVLTGVMSTDPLIAGSALSTIAVIHTCSTEDISLLLSPDVFSQCLVTLKSRSPAWASAEGFHFLSQLENGERLMSVYFEKFCLKLNILFMEKIKAHFFASFSLKEVLGKILTELLCAFPSYDQLVPLSRVLCQMVLAAKSKGSIEQFQKELVRLELERVRIGRFKQGFLCVMLRAVKLAC